MKSPNDTSASAPGRLEIALIIATCVGSFFLAMNALDRHITIDAPAELDRSRRAAGLWGVECRTPIPMSVCIAAWRDSEELRTIYRARAE